jgi:hypothetical protein
MSKFRFAAICVIIDKIIIIFRTRCHDVFVIYPHTKRVWVPNYSDSLIMAIGPKAKENVRMTVMMLVEVLQKCHINRCILSEDMLPYII